MSLPTVLWVKLGVTPAASGSKTLTRHSAVKPPSCVVTVSVVSPAFVPAVMTAPVSSVVRLIRFLSLTFQLTALLSALSGKTLTASVWDLPILKWISLAPRETAVTLTGMTVTFRLRVSFAPKASVSSSVTVALPTARAFIWPS